ncbi:MAG: glycosyltransferase family 4 protein [Desulfobulbaceae bacterium]
MNIFSPMAKGSGAYILHQSLSEKIKGYTLQSFNPYWTLCPPALPFLFPHNSHVDIIHTTPDYSFFFKKKIPLVVTFHGFVVDRETARYSTFLQKVHHLTALRFFIKLALKSATRVTCVSQFTAEMIRNNLNYTGKISVIYNGVDTTKFTPAKKQEDSKVKVLFSGNLTRRKGAHLLPDIASSLDKNIELCYTSGLRGKNPLPNMPNMRNIGPIPYAAMPAVYQGADILLFPTVREGFGLAAAEAMACGLPVVTTNCSSLPELVVDGKGGYLCEIGNTEEFARRINQLAQSSILRKEMGEFNRTRVEERFTLKQMVDNYHDLFTEVMDTSAQ